MNRVRAELLLVLLVTGGDTLLQDLAGSNSTGLELVLDNPCYRSTCSSSEGSVTSSNRADMAVLIKRLSGIMLQPSTPAAVGKVSL